MIISCTPHSNQKKNKGENARRDLGLVHVKGQKRGRSKKGVAVKVLHYWASEVRSTKFTKPRVSATIQCSPTRATKTLTR